MVVGMLCFLRCWTGLRFYDSIDLTMSTRSRRNVHNPLSYQEDDLRDLQEQSQKRKLPKAED